MRVALFVEIVNQECPRNSPHRCSLLVKPIPESTLSQRKRILHEAGLIRGGLHGVEMRNTSRHEEVNARYPGMLLATVAHDRDRG